jgi:hypothetical protein
MGFLLLQYEFQRANRKVNQLHATGIRLNNQIERYTKRVSNMQSIFSKAQTRLESKYTQITNILSAQISNAVQAAGTDAAKAGENFKLLLGNIQFGGQSLGLGGINVNTSTATGDNAAQTVLSILSSAAAQAKAMLTQLLEASKESDLNVLEAQQEEQLAPISEKEGDLEAENALNDSLTTLWEQRRDNAKEKLSQAIQNGMGHYGLK